MLRPFNGTDSQSHSLRLGQPVYLVTRDGEVLSGYTIKDLLMDQAILSPSPIIGSEKQGFSFRRGRLYPNWCQGRKEFRCACLSQEDAIGLTSTNAGKTL